MAKLMYEPLGLVTSVLGGMVAGAVFNRIWATFARRGLRAREGRGRAGRRGRRQARNRYLAGVSADPHARTPS